MIATPPSTANESGQAWLQAALVGSEAMEISKDILAQEKLPHNFIGHWLQGWGSVAGESELWGGAPALDYRHKCADNRLITEQPVSLNRKKLQNGLFDLFSRHDRPAELPFLSRYCPICHSLHKLYFGGGEDACSKGSTSLQI